MDIRTELNKLNKATLKDLVVRHDLHYYIKKTGSKAELVEGLARVYEHLKGIHVFAKPNKMQIMPRFSKEYMERAKQTREMRKRQEENRKLKEEYDAKKKAKKQQEVDDYLQRRIKSYNVAMEMLADRETKNTKLHDFPSLVRSLKALEKYAREEQQPWQFELLQKYKNLLQTNKLFANRIKRYSDDK